MGFYLTVDAEDEYGDTIEATVYSDDILDEIGETEISMYLENHGLTVIENGDFKRLANCSDYFAIPKYGYTKADLYEHLCNLLDVGHYTSKEDILKKLSEKF